MKMFTYCGNISTGEKQSYRGAVMHNSRRYGWRSSRKGQLAVALLLHTDDAKDPITNDDIAAFGASETIKELFPTGFIATQSDTVEGDWLLSSSAAYTDLPDSAKIDTPKLVVLTDAGLNEIDLRQRYNNCRSLIKAVGCTECPDKGLVCLRRGVPDTVEMPVVDHSGDSDIFKETLKNRKTTVGAFTYISPTLTIPDDHHFVPSLRHYEDHDFGNVESNSDKISTRNKTIAADNKFKKENCSVCPLKKSCTAFRNCAGPYPPSKDVTAQLLDTWAPKLTEPSPFTPWQFWALAMLGGVHGVYSRSSRSRYAVVLHGLRHSSRDGWGCDVWRAKGDISHLTTVRDYQTLRAVFENVLPETEEQAIKRGLTRPENDEAVALYLMLTEHSRSGRHRGGWGGDYYGLLYKELTNAGVRIKYSGPRYTRYSVVIDSYATYFKEISHRIGVSQLPKRTGLGIYPND